MFYWASVLFLFSCFLYIFFLRLSSLCCLEGRLGGVQFAFVLCVGRVGGKVGGKQTVLDEAEEPTRGIRREDF